MLLNPKLYEVNTRVWIKRFGKNQKLKDIPQNFINDLSEKGINILYMMGIWKTNESLIEKCCYEEGLVLSYNKSLKDWRREDVGGSPFAIDDYEINPAFGTTDDLKTFKEKLSKKGIKLFLDFVPNHFSAASKYINTNPEYFLQADEEILSRDSFTFFRPEANPDKVFAHGRDPLFPAWSDTIQLNYFNNETRSFMLENLFRISEICDGVRCDMAMLPLNNVFNNTWLGVLNKYGFKKPEVEFWKDAIEKVKEKKTDFVFLAEAYWDLEWDLQQLGFDFTYDKRLTDRLAGEDNLGIKAHLLADKSYQLKSVRFLENHDEQRAVTKFGKFKSLAAAVITGTVYGMKFYYDGQLEGRKIKLPVQLVREPVEKISNTVKKYYEILLKITKDEIFIKGNWTLLEPLSSGENDRTCDNILAWQWKWENEIRIIAVNYSDKGSQCRIRFDFNGADSEIVLKDLLTNENYKRSANEIKDSGLYIILKPYQSHIFTLL